MARASEMDRALDDIIADRGEPARGGGRRPPRRDRGRDRDRNYDRNYPRDGVKKNLVPSIGCQVGERSPGAVLTEISEWLHDKYVDDDIVTGRQGRRLDRYSTDEESLVRPAKLKVENLHYDITDAELKDLFARIGPVQSLRILFDRHDRSQGIAYVTYADIRDARIAIKDYNGANARGQPIRLTMVPSDPPPGSRRDYGTAASSSRSLFDRISGPDVRRRQTRSASPIRHSDVSKPAPDGIDRYVPSRRDGRSPRPRGPPRDNARRSGARREVKPKRDDQGHSMVQGRPRKTQEELDAEMADYWGGGTNDEAGMGYKNTTEDVVETGGAIGGAAVTTDATARVEDDDIDMIQ
ncbi:MAG: hypothetical protein M1821_003061 [Bathelium mastoideum]|nr:MAG: hypothetical protein M1821_003061 [Bathelium mastoideum]